MKHRFTNLAFDQYVANYYVNKIRSCHSRRIPFCLSLTQVRNMLRAKTCPLLGIDLTHTGAGASDTLQRPSDITIDRLDSSKPYQAGNVIAMSHKANCAKNGFEAVMGGPDSIKTIHALSKLMKKRGLV